MTTIIQQSLVTTRIRRLCSQILVNASKENEEVNEVEYDAIIDTATEIKQLARTGQELQFAERDGGE